MGMPLEQKSNSIIAVKLLEQLWHYFDFHRQQDQFWKDELKACQQLDKDFDLDYLAFQLTAIYILSRISSHLIQQSPINSQWIDELYTKYIREETGIH